MGVWYVYANVLGASMGAITNFLLGRYWAFQAAEANLGFQAFRYAIVAIGSVILNTLGIYILMEYFSITYIPSKVVIAVIIAITYNYLLQKYFVFKK